MAIEKRQPLQWGELATREPPPRRWATLGWLGFNHITSLIGPAGIGKTLFAQEWCTSLSINHYFIDENTSPLKVLMWACEDDHDELWRRQVVIARWLDAGFDAFSENLFIEPRAGLDNALVVAEYGRLLFTPLIEELRQQAGDYKADVVILDNVAQLYGANENDRHQVTSFLNALNGALPGRAVLLLAHPSRSAGSEYSGSSAWEAVVRTRLYLGRSLPDQKVQDDEVDDGDAVRYLCRRKANYGARDFRRFHYRDGVLVPDQVEVEGGVVAYARQQATERIVLDGLRKLAGMGMRATDGVTSPVYLPRLLLDYKLSDGRTKKELAETMRRLQVAGKLHRAEVGRGSNRHPVYGLEVT